MKLVIDVNVVISALIKDSTTRRILLNKNIDYYFPEKSFEKIMKYEVYILKKSGLSQDEFYKVLSKLFININLIKDESLKVYWERAKNIMQDIDKEDVVFIACALVLGNKSFIWSDDKDFRKQKIVPIITTKDLIKKFGIDAGNRY